MMKMDTEQKWAASKYGVEYFVVAARAGNEKVKSEGIRGL